MRGQSEPGEIRRPEGGFPGQAEGAEPTGNGGCRSIVTDAFDTGSAKSRRPIQYPQAQTIRPDAQNTPVLCLARRRRVFGANWSQRFQFKGSAVKRISWFHAFLTGETWNREPKMEESG